MNIFTEKKPSLWIRFVAVLIDAVCCTLVAVGLVYPFIAFDLFSERSGFDENLQHFLQRKLISIVALVLVVLYSARAESGAYQATLGKRLFGLMVVRNNGKRLSLPGALGRAIIKYVTYSYFGIGYLMLLFRKDKRAGHDLTMDTKVVYKY